MNKFMNRIKLYEEDGVGNCSLCIPDENNKFCKYYNPISLYTVDSWIEEEEEE
jgi:hypothetical protein